MRDKELKLNCRIPLYTAVSNLKTRATYTKPAKLQKTGRSRAKVEGRFLEPDIPSVSFQSLQDRWYQGCSQKQQKVLDNPDTQTQTQTHVSTKAQKQETRAPLVRIGAFTGAFAWV